MASHAETIRNFYSAVAAGDTARAKTVMAEGVDWVNVQPWDQRGKDELQLFSSFIAQTSAERYSKGWSFQLKGRGSAEVTQHVILPFLEEGSSLLPLPSPSERKARRSCGWAL
jgi:hypothetical protein